MEVEEVQEEVQVGRRWRWGGRGGRGGGFAGGGGGGEGGRKH